MNETDSLNYRRNFMGMNQTANFAIIDCCDRSIIGWSANRDTSVYVAITFAKIKDCTTAVVNLSNRQIKLFKSNGETTMWFLPGDKNSSVEFAKDFKRDFLTDVIVTAAYNSGMDSEWIKTRLGNLCVN
jgi:hypothetical protein